jgi:S1-C subfamily serine protease
MADNPDPDTVARVKRGATARLLAIPGVVAVGIGQKVVGDDHTGVPAIKVFVRDKRPLAEVPADEVIPAAIDGVPTDVEIGGDRIPIAAVDQPGVFDLRAQKSDVTTYRPLVGGCRITTRGGHLGSTGGCLLQDTGTPDAGYLLTNHHVVKAPDIAEVVPGVTRVGQPIGSVGDAKPYNDTVGVFAGGGETAERDEAVVRLSPGMKWQAKIVDIGLVAGSHTLTQADVTVTGKPYQVAKRGQKSKVTGGTIVALAVTSADADNLITVKPNPNSAAGTDTVFFVIEGDSGSALVNGANEVVGLLFARDETGLGYAYHIDHVLKRLKDIDGLSLKVASSKNAGEVHKVPGANLDG